MNTLRQSAHEYLAMRRSLGFKLRRVAPRLLDSSPSWSSSRLRILRSPGPCLGQATSGRATGYLGAALELRAILRAIPTCHRPAYRGSARRAVAVSPKASSTVSVFGSGDLRVAARSPKLQRQGLQPDTYYCLLGLLSVSGMRVGEVRNLQLQDVDLKERLLTIRGAKFGKDRLVPLHPSSCRVLARYLERRQRLWAKRPVSNYLFVSSRGNRLDDGDIRRTFYAISRQIGLRGPADRGGLVCMT